MKGMKTGGRQKGTPNKTKKEDPLKVLLRTHSAKYFSPNSKGVSQFDLDLQEMAPEARANIEVKIVDFHTPKMKAVDMDVNAEVKMRTIEDKLRALCGNDSDDGDDEEEDAE